MVGEPRIGLGPHAPPPATAFSIGVLGIEPRPYAPKAYILPLYYTPALAMAGRQNVYTTPVPNYRFGTFGRVPLYYSPPIELSQTITEIFI